MERYLIDTNIVSAYFSGAIPAKHAYFMDEVINSVPNLSIITQIELLCWNTTGHTMNMVESFISDSSVFDITSDVISHCVGIRKHKKIKTPDAIIAATAMANDFTLITNDKKDFGNIKGLKVITLLD